jgi:hypothetical protein
VQCNAASLLRMIQDTALLWSLKIELSDLVEGLAAIVKFTYIMKGDDQLAFKAGKSVDALISLYPNGKVCILPSTNRLIEQHLQWTDAQGLFPPLEPVIRQTIKEETVKHKTTAGASPSVFVLCVVVKESEL